LSEPVGQRTTFGISTVETLFAWFQRIIAVYCLMFGILYWVRLIGFYEGTQWRFDLMPVHWQIVSTMLAVFFPFAAAGLWMLASWGPVIWFICAVTETVMYGAFPRLFGAHYAVIASHLFAAALYVTFRVVISLQRAQAERQG
jgi:hypothetical protein